MSTARAMTLSTTRSCKALALVIAGALGLHSNPAQAGCGWDPICYISQSIGEGAGKGLADNIRPLVTDVMEREAPELISQLKTAVDHNIMTAEEASEKLSDYATNLLNKAADDILGDAQNRSQKLIDYAHDQTLSVEQQVFNDVRKIIDDLHCETLSVDTLVERQQKIFDENVNSWLLHILFWQSRRDRIEAACRSELGISNSLKTAQMQIPTSFRLWRCVRLSYVAPNGPATAIRDAYDDVAFNGRAMMCALKTGSDVALREVTETWITDNQSATAWDRAIRGE